MEETYMQKTNFKTLDLCMIGVVTAVIVIMAQISIPMPLGVPMTMQTFAITLAGVILGSKKGAVASLIYVLLGAVGVPVFANFSGYVLYHHAQHRLGCTHSLCASIYSYCYFKSHLGKYTWIKSKKESPGIILGLSFIMQAFFIT